MTKIKKYKWKTLLNLYEEHIRGTEQKAFVFEKTVSLCNLTLAVMSGIKLEENKKVYITSVCLKHLYDKKPAEEFDFLVNYLYKIVMHPDTIYKNKDPKRGDFCFRKKLLENEYLCSIEVVENGELFIATAFRLRKESYLNSYELLWNWRDGNPSS